MKFFPDCGFCNLLVYIYHVLPLFKIRLNTCLLSTARNVSLNSTFFHRLLLFVGMVFNKLQLIEING